MNSKIIRELVNQFNNVHETSDYAEYMMYNEKLSEYERYEYELEADMSMYVILCKDKQFFTIFQTFSMFFINVYNIIDNFT